MEEDMTKAADTPAARSRDRGPLTPGSFAAAGSGLAEELAERLGDVEEILVTAVAQADHLADEASHHLLAAGGKRVRPMLVLLTAQLGDGSRPEVRSAAAAVELIHLATLYHDDVMDDAPLRRGAPAAQHVWGNSVAILTGDLLFARASLLSAQLGVEAVRLQAETFERLVLGQLAEFSGPPAGADPIEHYLRVLADKTGSLIAAAGEFGLIYSNGPRELIGPLRDFGERVGIAFQLADDLIDLAGDGAKTGKTPGTDLREGVPTLPVLYARRAAAAGDAQAAQAIALLDEDLSSDAALEAARRAVVALPATAQAAAEAR
ncbi:polyprenyl synthetase family protein, partial [Brevibacterium sp. 5221]|nr:polyprenyl synthetase family protein [Brevibacterium rongguiense]